MRESWLRAPEAVLSRAISVGKIGDRIDHAWKYQGRASAGFGKRLLLSRAIFEPKRNAS